MLEICLRACVWRSRRTEREGGGSRSEDEEGGMRGREGIEGKEVEEGMK